ncbi:MAG: hypothetical protein GF344_03010 [Chitinivibrionales bacterium]|nr:hypothetical protein [Chitinivibrionales bacterium]MBD3356049.1 hypothetical protein [Chitinivibrionales bacterium]
MKAFKEIKFRTPPTLIAAWPGMGNVGLIAVDYLRKSLGAQLFAQMDMSPYFIPESIVVKDGIAQLPDMPMGIFHYHETAGLIVFESNAQVGGRDGLAIIGAILDMAAQYQVTRVYTAAGFAQPMSHSSESQVLCASNTKTVLADLVAHDVVAMPDGYIAGLNGLLLGVAATRGLDAACFLGTIPSYATNLSYPKASLSILQTVGRALELDLELALLEESVLEADMKLAEIEERIRRYFPALSEQEEDTPELEEHEVPGYIMDRIERLFEAVKEDKSRAKELKDELSRWNLYELYEHRFLDLFKSDSSEEDR